MRIFFLLLCLVSLAGFSAHAAPQNTQSNAQPRTISFIIGPDVLEDFRRFTGGRPLLSIRKIDSSVRRDVLEVFSTLYMLEIGDLNFKAVFVPLASRERADIVLGNGKVAMSAAWVSEDDAGAHGGVHTITPPFGIPIQLAGLFTSPHNHAALNAKTRTDMSKLTAVSTTSWRTDWAALQNSNLKEVFAVTQWPAMHRTVWAQRVDFLLAPRQYGSQGAMETTSGKLIQLKPFAVLLSAKRQILISENHADSAVLIAAISKGIEILGSKNFIATAFKRLSPPKGVYEKLIILNVDP